MRFNRTGLVLYMFDLYGLKLNLSFFFLKHNGAPRGNRSPAGAGPGTKTIPAATRPFTIPNPN